MSYWCWTEDQEFESTQLNAIGLRKASGIPKELTKARACGLSSAQSLGTSFLTREALSVDKYPYRRKAASSSTLIKAYNDLNTPKTFYRGHRCEISANECVSCLYLSNQKTRSLWTNMQHLSCTASLKKDTLVNVFLLYDSIFVAASLEEFDLSNSCNHKFF